MRKRGFALHGDTIEDYIELSDAISDQAGFFYNRSGPQNQKGYKNKKSLKQNNSTCLSQPSKRSTKGIKKYSRVSDETVNFLGFDFNADEYEEQQAFLKLQKQEKQRRIRQDVVILSEGDQSKKRLQILSSIGETIEEDQVPENRQINLIKRTIKKDENGSQKCICLNIWLINEEKVHNPLIETYLKVVKQIYIIQKEGKNISYPGKSTTTFSLVEDRVPFQLKQILQHIQQQIKINC